MEQPELLPSVPALTAAVSEGDASFPRARELDVLDRVAGLMAGGGDLAEAVAPALELLGNHLDMRFATLALVDNAAGEIAIDLAHGLTGEQIRLGHYRLGEGVTGRVAATGRSAIVPSTARDPDFLDRTGRGKREDTAFLCVPVRLGGEVLGTLSVDGQPKSAERLQADARFLEWIAALMAQAIRLRRDARAQREDLLAENQRLRGALAESVAPDNLIGKSREMRIVHDQIAQVAPSAATVLIHGETGTGKEMVAQAIHYHGPRAERPFIRVNCAALPESLIESELFGHEKGAFTGAVARRDGRFSQADGGTIFLDEIGEISPLVQVKLLRVLQERAFERVGGNQTLHIDVRVVAATNRDLMAMVREGRFRADLFYRINVFPVYLVPLRSRQSDIPLLAEHFLAKYGAAAGKRFDGVSAEAMDLMMGHSWPGNVRELENCVEYAVVLSPGGAIRAEHLPPGLRNPAPDEDATDWPEADFKTRVENFERGLLKEALARTHGNIRQAAQHLGTTPRIVAYRLRQLGLDPADFL